MYDGAEYEQITGENFEPMLEGEHASVYTANRLEYLNPYNDADIADIIKEYNLNDVSTACAIWYGNTVNEMVDALIDAVLSYEYQTGCPHFTGADSGAVCTKCSKFPTI